MHFIQITENDVEDVMKFINADLGAVEPLLNSLALTKDDADTFFRGVLSEAVRSTVSYFVKTDEQQIIAVRLSTFRTRNDSLMDPEHLPKLDSPTRLDRAKAILCSLNKQFWDAVPDIDKIYYLMAVIVQPRFQYTDLVDKLVHYNMDEVRTMGAQGLVVNAGIFHNESLLEHLGYRIVAEVDRDGKNMSPRWHFFFNDDDYDSARTQLAYKEMWRGETSGTHIVV